MTPLRTRLENRMSDLMTERSSWEPHWSQISTHIAPRRGRMTLTDERHKPGVNREMINPAPARALKIAVAGLMSGMTSPSRPWLRLGVLGQEDTTADERVWLDEVRRRMLTVMQASNVYQTLPAVYRELLAFGTGVMIVVEDFDNVVWTDVLTVGRYWIARDARKKVTTLFRELRMTVEQVVERFGRGAVSEEVRGCFDRGELDRLIDIRHALTPRDVAPGESPFNNRAPFASYYWEIGRGGDAFLEEGGSAVAQFIGCAWETLEEEAYGVSPGMDALPHCKALQQMERDLAELRHRLNRPTLNAPAHLHKAGRRVTQIPGGVNYYTANDRSKGGAEPVFTVEPRALEQMRIAIAEKEQDVMAAFHADLFMMFSDLDRRQITAEEISKRYEEKILMLGPVVERLHDDLLKPLIDIVFAHMTRNDLIPPPPPSMEGRDIRVDFISVLAQAQKSAGLNAIERVLGVAGTLAQMGRPDALDKIDADALMDETLEITGAAPAVLHDADEVAEIRRARAEAQQQQAMMENAQPLASAASLISEANARGEGAL